MNRTKRSAEFAARLTAQGIPEQYAADVAALCGQVARNLYADTTTTVAELTGRPATTFDHILTTDRADAACRCQLTHFHSGTVVCDPRSTDRTSPCTIVRSGRWQGSLTIAAHRNH